MKKDWLLVASLMWEGEIIPISTALFEETPSAEERFRLEKLAEDAGCVIVWMLGRLDGGAKLREDIVQAKKQKETAHGSPS